MLGALALLAVLLLTGCSRLPGAHDRVLAYALAPGVASQELAILVRRRLRAARVSAEVKIANDRLIVLVDQDDAPLAEELLSWRGGLTAHASTSRCAPLSWAQGPRVRRLVEDCAQVAPLALLDEGLRLEQGPGTLTIAPAPGSPAARELEALAGREIVLARGTIVLYMGTPGPLERPVLRFGEGLPSRARARSERELLQTPRLPSLPEPSRSQAPPDPRLPVLVFALPVLLSLAYLAFVRRFDRAHPEPRGLVALTFALGALSTIPAFLLEVGAMKLSPWLSPELLTFGGLPEALPLSILGFALLVGLPEEGAKLLGTAHVLRRREFDEPVDGIVYAVVSALGFAAAENMRYLAYGRAGASLVASRAFTALPAHLFFAALWGYALGQRLVRKRAHLPLWLGLAALAHGAYDALLSTEGTGVFALLLNLLLATAFVLVVRSALRHGPVSDATQLAAGEPRRSFRVGRPGVFLALSALLHGIALSLVALGALWEASFEETRADYIFPMIFAVMALGATAWGVTATLPLDVVLDSHGVTFAGAVRAWGDVRRATIHGRYLDIEARTGDIELGPASPETLEALARAIRERLG